MLMVWLCQNNIAVVYSARPLLIHPEVIGSSIYVCHCPVYPYRSMFAVNNAVVTKYKVLKLMPQNGFNMKNSVMEDERKYNVQRELTRQHLKRHIPPVSLLLCFAGI